jgi:hypothetical protein
VGEQGQAACEGAHAGEAQRGVGAEADAFAGLGGALVGGLAAEPEADARAPGDEGARGQVGGQRRVARHGGEAGAPAADVFVENAKNAAAHARPPQQRPEHGGRVAH